MLSIIGLIILIVVTVQAYKAAKSYGRNAVAWAFITFGVGFGIQIIIPLIFGIIYGIVIAAGGGTASPQQLQRDIMIPALVVSVVCIVLSIVAVLLILRYLSKVPEEKSFTPPPQPPENFV